MSIITISRGSFGFGHMVAEKVVERLGYSHVCREVLLQASEEYNVPEVKLEKAYDKASPFLDRLINGDGNYVDFIKAAILEHMIKDNVVYEGFAGHYFIRNISHVLKVRISADLEDRVKLVMAGENLSRQKALNFIKKVDQQRKKWGLSLYRLDFFDPALYDLVINVSEDTVDEAVDLIIETLNSDRFKTTPESESALYDIYAATRVKTKLRIGNYPAAEVDCNDGVIKATVLAPLKTEKEILADISAITDDMDGVIDIRAS